MTQPASNITVSPENPAAPQADALIRDYFSDLIARYYSRPALNQEVAEAMLDEPSDELYGDGGLFLIARDGDKPVGCGGFRFVSPDGAELTRIFVKPTERGRGLATIIIAELEDSARAAGAQWVRLDTRSDLVEARALYAKLGYIEGEPFNDSIYAQHWFSKKL